MQTPYGHLTYCTNIHAGESWQEHFAALRVHVPAVKKAVSPSKPFGIGLRLCNQASVELSEESVLKAFREWLAAEDCYVFTMNGFPYGGFHHMQVKDQVHAPDWTTNERVSYTLRMFRVLSALLPEHLQGGISTAPLSYKHWHPTAADKERVMVQATEQLLQVVAYLVQVAMHTGQVLHLDIEPEPDGLLENGQEFLHWYLNYLLPIGIGYLQRRLEVDSEMAGYFIRNHVRLCYDICHFAVGYEDHAEMIRQLYAHQIKTGKIQVSAALKAVLPFDRKPVLAAFQAFNESTYLHQVVARHRNGTLKRYPDLPLALATGAPAEEMEWRAHFHVPLFVADYGLLQSTQSDIMEVLALQRARQFTGQLEVETYTWEVLPNAMKLPLTDSIIRELAWLQDLLEPVAQKGQGGRTAYPPS